MPLRSFLFVATASIALAACSSETAEDAENTETETETTEQTGEETTGGLTSQQQYDRSIECAASVDGMANLWSILADIQEENAADYTARADERRELALLFARHARELSQELNISDTQVTAALNEAAQGVGQRVSEAGMEQGAIALGREADACANEMSEIFDL